MQDEFWKDVIGYEGIYQVSNTGRVKSLARANTYFNPRVGKEVTRYYKDRFMKVKKNRGGYYTAHLRDEENGLETWPVVHRLVAEAFIPNEKNKPTVNHIDGVKTNNHVSNLEWATHSENTQHAFDMGLAKPCRNQKSRFGSASHQAKLTEQQVIEIRKLRGTGMTLTSIAEIYDVYFSTIHKICKRESWTHI
jgi:hypothetical protein